jgi:hypothetical protein
MFLNMFISFLYMFRATMCPSAVETIPPCIPDSHPYRVTSTKCRINTVVFSWRWVCSRPKHVEKRNKHTKKNCAPSWLYLQDHTRKHGQQNTKFKCHNSWNFQNIIFTDLLEWFRARWPLGQDVLDPQQFYRHHLGPKKRCIYPLYQMHIPAQCPQHGHLLFHPEVEYLHFRQVVLTKTF